MKGRDMRKGGPAEIEGLVKTGESTEMAGLVRTGDPMGMTDSLKATSWTPRENEAPRKRTPRWMDSSQYECPLCPDFQAATETGLIRHCLKDIQEKVDLECGKCGEVKKAK